MKNKSFTLIELMIVILIVGILAAVMIPILRVKIDAAKEIDFKTEFLAGEQFKQIVGDDPNYIKEGELTVSAFQMCLHDNYSYLQFATDEDVENYLKLREQSAIGLTEEDRKFEEKVLMAMVDKAKKERDKWR